MEQQLQDHVQPEQAPSVEQPEILSMETAEQTSLSAGDELAAILGKKRRKTPKALKLGAVLSVLAILGGGGWYAYRLYQNSQTEPTAPTYREYTVEKGSIIVGQTETSSISLSRETVSYPFSATVEEVYVKAGSSVKKGDPLMKFNAEQVKISLNSYSVELQDASLAIQKAQLQKQAQELKAKQTLETTTLAGDLANTTLAVSLDQLESNLLQKEQAVQDALDKVDEYAILNGDIYYDLDELEDLEADMEYYADRVSAAQANLTSYKNYATQLKTYQSQLVGTDYTIPTEAELTAYENRMHAASAAVEAAEQAYDAAVTDYNTAYESHKTDPSVDIDTPLNAMNTSKKAFEDAQKALSEATTNYNNAKNAQSNLDSATKTNASVQSMISSISLYMSALGTSETDVSNQVTAAQNAYNGIKADYEELKADLQEKYNGSLDADNIYETYVKAREEASAARLSLRQQELSSETGTSTANQTAETALANAEMSALAYEVALMESVQQVDAAQDTYDVLQDTIAEIKDLAADDGMVYAPCNGMIASLNVSEGDNVTVMLNNDGEIMAYATLLTMTDISSVYVPVTVSEEDILKVYIGQPARVTMTAFSGKTFAAEVDSIAVESSRSGAATVSYTVTVRLEGDNALDMYEGMSAQVTLLQKAVDDVLYVQNQAITFTDGISTVLVKDENGDTVTREVKTGFSDGQNVEILDGLSQGDTVLAESSLTRR